MNGHSPSITDRILEYEQSIPQHRAGTVEVPVLQALERLVQAPLDFTVETGCGKSTILLSNLSRAHVVFAVDDSSEERSSIAYFKGCPVFRADRTRLVLGPTQATLPSFEFPSSIDLAFLDGPHGYPFPELEYAFIYPHLRPGSILVIDDIHIPTIHRLFEFLREDDMFALADLVQTTAFFRRTEAPALDRFGDGWWLQKFNTKRFPVAVSMAPPETIEDGRLLREEITRLQAERAELSQSLAWWQHAADERRLRRRLARLLGR